MGVRIFSNEDEGAPVLKDQPGSLINILKACLIDGYGSATPTSPHGSWEVITDSTGRKGAFRSTDPDANGFWFYIDDNANNTADVGMAEVFTGFDASDVPKTDTTWMLQPQTNAWQKTESPDISPWKVIADERFFYWIHMSSVRQAAFDNNGWPGAWAGEDGSQYYDPANGSYQTHGWQSSGNAFGDLINTSASDTNATIVTKPPSPSFSPLRNNRNGAIGDHFNMDVYRVARDASGANNGINASVTYQGNESGNSEVSSSDGEQYPAPATPHGLIIGPQSAIYEDITGNFGKRYRGQLPGVFPVPMRIGDGPAAGFGADFIKWGTYTAPFNNTIYSGRTFTITGIGSGNGNANKSSIAFIDLTGPWR